MQIESKFSCCSMSKQDIIKLENQAFPDAKIIHILKLLAHPLRLKIARLLIFEEQICTCEIVPVFGSMTDTKGNKVYSPESIQVQITKQLTKLKNEGILLSRKITFTKNGEPKAKTDGKWTSYKINPEYFSIIKNILESFKGNSDNFLELNIETNFV